MEAAVYSSALSSLNTREVFVAITGIIAWDIKGYPWILLPKTNPINLHKWGLDVQQIIYYCLYPDRRGAVLLYQTKKKAIRLLAVIPSSYRSLLVHKKVQCASYLPKEERLLLCLSSGELVCSFFQLHGVGEKLIEGLCIKSPVEFFPPPSEVIEASAPSPDAVAQVILRYHHNEPLIFLRTNTSDLFIWSNKQWSLRKKNVDLIYSGSIMSGIIGPRTSIFAQSGSWVEEIEYAPVPIVGIRTVEGFQSLAWGRKAPDCVLHGVPFYLEFDHCSYQQMMVSHESLCDKKDHIRYILMFR